ncbi:response regulator transcription factor [Plantibacter sp. VKM Ac-2880]|uniref:response regulator transcription factor n=1 Tax=Plantibacter sp. VKM Ac-2880 TaxID=2783827 RepID=UPI00188F50AB|nr:response regulator transcription factor [Plantibacter sp. VKM Ac-2880]MBF4568958.1 response regulator transcription factor [Plantibacter sp. VKM Ac-2880]
MTSPDHADGAPLRIVIAEDSTLLREGLLRLFDEAGFVTVAAYADAVAVQRGLATDRPDLIVMDVRMPPTFRDEGVRAAIALRAAHPDLPVLLLSQYVETVYARELLADGGRGVGYLLKDRVTSLEEVQDAIHRLVGGGTVLDPDVVRTLFATQRDPLSALTPRETEVLAAMAEGRTNAAIAQRLLVGVGAVEKHISAIFQKLGLEDSGSDHRRVLAVLALLQRQG